MTFNPNPTPNSGFDFQLKGSCQDDSRLAEARNTLVIIQSLVSKLQKQLDGLRSFQTLEDDTDEQLE